MDKFNKNKTVGDRRFHNFIVSNYELDNTLVEIETEDEIYQLIKTLRKSKIKKKKMGRISAWKKINK